MIVPLKIAIEAQRIFRKDKHGMDFVVLETIRQLQIIDTINQYYILVSPGEDHCLKGTKNFKIIELSCPTYPLWEQIALPHAISKIKPDLLHCTSNTAPIYTSVPLVLTLHDIIFLEKRQSGNKSLYQNLGWYYRRFVVPRILPKCKKIITVSNFECSRIQQSLNLPNEKIMFIYNGVSSHFYPREETLSVSKKYIDADKYIFFLGNTDPKKNVPRTLKAYSLYVNKTKEPLPLLIADLNETYLNAILKEQEIEHIKPLLYSPGYISNTDLAYLYSGASLFLYTSLRESFGIPILESMACGTPVITSNTSSMPEISGRGGICIDPTDEKVIADEILHLLEDKNYYNEQITYGLTRAKEFSWKHTAQKVLNVYQSIKQ